MLLFIDTNSISIISSSRENRSTLLTFIFHPTYAAGTSHRLVPRAVGSRDVAAAAAIVAQAKPLLPSSEEAVYFRAATATLSCSCMQRLHKRNQALTHQQSLLPQMTIHWPRSLPHHYLSLLHLLIFELVFSRFTRE